MRKKLGIWMLVLMLLLPVLAGCSAKDAVSRAAAEMDVDYYSDGEILERDEAKAALRAAQEQAEKEKENREAETEETEEQEDSDEKQTRFQIIEGENADGETAQTEETASSAKSDKKKNGSGNKGSGSSEDSGNTSSGESGSNETENEGGNQNSSSKKNTVTISIRCDTAVNIGMAEDPTWAGIVPADGTILASTKMEFEEGDTVFDVLCDVRDTYKLHMQYEGAAGAEYIQGINNLYEFDGGRWSGWMYCVNDWYPNYGCGQYAVKNGDVIEWNYTCDLGKDLGQDWLGDDWTETHE